MVTSFYQKEMSTIAEKVAAQAEVFFDIKAAGHLGHLVGPTELLALLEAAAVTDDEVNSLPDRRSLEAQIEEIRLRHLPAVRQVRHARRKARAQERRAQVSELPS